MRVPAVVAEAGPARRPSIRRLAVIGAAAVTFALFGLVAALFVANARWSVEEEVASAFGLAGAYLDARRGRIAEAREPMAEAAAVAAELDVLRHVSAALVDADGTPTTASADADPGAAPSWFVVLIGTPAQRVEQPVVRYPNRLGTIVLTANPQDEIDEVWEDFRIVMPAILVAGAGALALSLTAILIVLAQVDAVAAALRAMRAGDLSARAPAQRFDEFAGLAADANALAIHLAAERRENRRLLLRMMRLSEDERRALASDLHDGLGPGLFALRAALRSAADLRPTDEDEAGAARAQALDAAARHADAVQAICRSAIESLRPMMLGEAPLAELLEELAVGFRAIEPRARVVVAVEGPVPSTLGELGDLCVYRFAQESALNAIRHGRARAVTIALRREAAGGAAGGAATLLAEVRDDGSGPAAPPGSAPRRGQMGMADRARALQGDYVAPRPRDGSIVTTLRLPLRPGEG